MPRWVPSIAAASSVVGVEERGENVQVLGLRDCSLSRRSSLIKIQAQQKDASSNAAVGVCIGLRGELQLLVVCPWLAGIVCCSVSESKSSESKAKSSVPVRKTERRVREALLNLPPYPPSVRVLLRVQSCFQSVLIQSEVLSPSA